MATIVFGDTGSGVFFSTTLSLSTFFGYDFQSALPSSWKLFDDAQNFTNFSGSGLTYIVNGAVVGSIETGRFTSFSYVVNGISRIGISGLNLSAPAVFDSSLEPNATTFVSLLLSGNDSILGTTRYDIIHAGAGNDVMRSNGGGDRLYGDDGNDKLIGAAGADWLNGGNGRDVLIGGADGDLLYGDDGVDTASYETSTTGVIASFENTAANTNDAAGDTYYAVENITGSSFADRLIGGYTGNTLLGGLGTDRLEGKAGNDRIDGGKGADRMFGGLDSDVYVVDNAGDFVSEAGGGGVDTVITSVSFNLANPARAVGAIENITLLNVAGALNLVGNPLSNVLAGNARSNALHGGAGNDRLFGHDGNDQLFGGTGNDTLSGGRGSDVYGFGNGLNATANRDVIVVFVHGQDKIWLDNAVFAKLGGGGPHALNPAFFQAGAAADDANDYLVYNRTNGSLSYDVNGNGAGGSVVFAILGNRPLLTASDFVVI
jgi:serralysin